MGNSQKGWTTEWLLPVFFKPFLGVKMTPEILKAKRHEFALYSSETILGKHVFLHVVIAVAVAMIGRHNSLAQKLEAEIIRMVSLHCHAHHLASACCYTTADLYSMVYETAKALLMHLWKCFYCFTVAVSLLGDASNYKATAGIQNKVVVDE